MHPVRVLSAIALIGCSCALAAQPALDPGTILATADSSIAHARTAIYNARITGLSPNGSPYSTAAHIYLSRLDPPDETGYKVRMEIDNGVIAYDGTRTWIVNPPKKTVTELDRNKPFKSYIQGFFAGRLIERIFWRDTPFGSMTDSARLEEDRSTEGIDCHVLSAREPDEEMLSEMTIRYYFGASDGFLRRQEMSGKYSGMMTTDTMTITDLRLNVPIHDSLFTIEIPADFQLESAAAPAKREPTLAVGAAAPGWTLPDTSGKETSLSDLKGRVVVLDFWYINCPPCIRSMPKLERIQKAFSRDDVVVVGVNTFDTKEQTTKYLRTKGLGYRFLLDGRAVAASYKVGAFPTLFVIGKDGAIEYMTEGDDDELEEELTQAIRRAMEKR